MPIIRVESRPLSYEKKKEIAKVFTDEFHKITGIPKDPIMITFHDLSPEHIASGGEMLPEQLKAQQKK